MLALGVGTPEAFPPCASPPAPSVFFYPVPAIILPSLPYRNFPRGFFPMATYHWLMNNHDDQLHRLLRQCRDIEVPGDFDANVRRRIRLAQTEGAGVPWLAWLWRPAFSLPVTLAVGLLIGLAGAMFASPQRPPTSRSELTFMAPTTLAGAVLHQETRK